MKYVTIIRQAPGVDNALACWAMFQKLGMADNTLSAYAAADGKSYVYVSDGEVEMARMLSFAPYFEEITVLPVVDIDDEWAGAAAAAVANLAG